MIFTGPATALTSADIDDVAKFLGANRAAVLAVMEVEAAGAGFDARARPRILFEPHVFYRELRGAERARAVKAALAYKDWGTRRYPRSSDARYRQLRAAMKINHTAALKSASWGLGQVMGFNYALAGFDSVEAFVNAMVQGEREQLLAMAGFIKSRNLHLPMRRREWSKFARGYNGPGYRKNRYDTKLARAYQRHLNAGDSAAPRVPSALRSGDRGGEVRAWQENLAKLGYTVAVDGAFGPQTEAATRLFQKRFELEVDGIVGPVTRNAMAEALKGRSPAAVPAEIVPVTPTETKASLFEKVLAFLAELFIQTSREMEA